ncbi:MAG: hypothetical protein GKS05_13145 [Nitrospirales bacterium]|nr:hypothetical protein [Nitrospirales bacterium]
MTIVGVTSAGEAGFVLTLQKIRRQHLEIKRLQAQLPKAGFMSQLSVL